MGNLLKNKQNCYSKGIVSLKVFDLETHDLIAYTDKLTTGSLKFSQNDGEITGGLNNATLMKIPDSFKFTGECSSADFSLKARQLQLGTSLKWGASNIWMERIIATSPTLKITGTPVPYYTEQESQEVYAAFVTEVGKTIDGTNYGVNKNTKEIQNFTAEVGKEYCVSYYIRVVSGLELKLPTTRQAITATIQLETNLYSNQGTSAEHGSKIGTVVVHIPKASFSQGSPDMDVSQTDTTATSWAFEALAYSETNTLCNGTDSLYGYMNYIPTNFLESVTGLIVVGGDVRLDIGDTLTIPVKYVMVDGEIEQPQYSDLVYSIADPTIASISTDGLLTGLTTGSTTLTITISGTSITKTIEVTVL